MREQWSTEGFDYFFLSVVTSCSREEVFTWNMLLLKLWLLE